MNNSTNQQQPPPPVPQVPPEPPGFLTHRPGRAAVCAIIPGIGAVYNREYVKAVVHFSIFASLTIIAESVGIFSLAAFAFYLYTIIDAYRSAEAIAQRFSSKTQQKADKTDNLNLLLWGGILIAMGVLFLLDNLGAIRLRDAVEYWPILLILLGGYLVFSQYRRKEPGFSTSNKNREGD